MQLTFLLLCSFVGMALSLVVPLIWSRIDLNNKDLKREYVAKLRHALDLVGASANNLQIIEMWEKPEIIRTQYEATYIDQFKRQCTLDWTVNDITESEVPEMPVCPGGSGVQWPHSKTRQ